MKTAAAYFNLQPAGAAIGLVKIPVGESIDPRDLPRPLPEKIVGNPVQLKPVPFGKPDRSLARVVCRHMAEVNAPTVIPFNPLTESKLHSLLRSLRIVHH
jgi:hypothetical protein